MRPSMYRFSCPSHYYKVATSDKGYPHARVRSICFIVFAEELHEMLLLVCSRVSKALARKVTAYVRVILFMKKYHKTPAYPRVHITFPIMT